MANEDCIFCKIASHEIRSNTVYEDEFVLAFDDLNPQAPVHVLVIPKEHYENVQDNVSSDLFAHMIQGAIEVARLKGIDQSGYRLITNCGPDAGQTVFHWHVHVLGGASLGEGMVSA